MKNEQHLPNYDVALEMISAFQWLPEEQAIRLFIDKPVNTLVGDSLHSLAEEINQLHPASSLMNMQVAIGTFLRQQTLVYACGLREIVDEAARLVEFVGTTPEVIGLTNLHLAAYVLRVRTTSPSAWNSFCRDIDKMDWMTSEEPSSSSSSAPLSVGGVAADGYEKVMLGGSGCADDGADGWSKLDATQVGQQDAMPSVPESPRRGLARAFDNEAFNEKAERLLNPHQEEDIAAGREVISGPEPMPTRCSAFHKVIQEKITTLRTGYKGGKR
jgi:hypothetical protein